MACETLVLFALAMIRYLPTTCMLTSTDTAPLSQMGSNINTYILLRTALLSYFSVPWSLFVFRYCTTCEDCLSERHTPYSEGNSSICAFWFCLLTTIATYTRVHPVHICPLCCAVLEYVSLLCCTSKSINTLLELRVV